MPKELEDELAEAYDREHGPWVILDRQDHYLTTLPQGKARRGWTKDRDRAARFGSYESAEVVLAGVAGSHTRTARIVRMASITT